jgi:alkylhydroperoxidase/carboxymuconolactone decarboxylase family protein YurZ
LIAVIRERSPRPDSLFNLHAQMAPAPALLGAYLGVRRALEELSTLNLKTRSAIMVTVSAADDAEYALAVNTVVATRAGWTPWQIAGIRAGLVGDAKLKALLDVAREAALDFGRVQDATWAMALKVGWTEAELAEAFTSVALTLFVDYFVHFAQTPLDVPLPGTFRPASEPLRATRRTG